MSKPRGSPSMNIGKFKPTIVYTIYIAPRRKRSGRR